MKSLRLFPFRIELMFGKKKYQAIVEQTYLSDTIEIFTVKNHTKTIVIKSNRPLIRGKGLTQRKIKMHALHAKINYQTPVEKIIECIETHIYKLEQH
jgi:CRISPR/Cas system CMR-associated protein Cmr5 small subunit